MGGWEGETRIPKYCHQNSYIKSLRVLCNRFDTTRCCRKLSRKQINHNTLRLHQARSVTGRGNGVPGCWGGGGKHPAERREPSPPWRERHGSLRPTETFRSSAAGWETFTREPVPAERSIQFPCSARPSRKGKVALVLQSESGAGEKKAAHQKDHRRRVFKEPQLVEEHRWDFRSFRCV